MQSTIFTEEIHHFVRYEIKDDIVAIEIFRSLNQCGEQSEYKKVDQFFSKLTPTIEKSLKSKNPMTVSKIFSISEKNRFYLYKDEDLKKLNTAFSGGTDSFFDVLRSMRSRDEGLSYCKTLEKIQPENVCRFLSESHLIENITGIIVSIPRYYDYICGDVKEREYDLIPVLDKLKTNPYIKKIKKVTIPYYNCDDDYPDEKAIEFVVHLPQDAFNEFVEKSKKIDKKYWGAHMWELIVDPKELGIEEFRKNKNDRITDWDD